MTSRRSFVRTVTGAVAGSIAVVGRAVAAAARSPGDASGRRTPDGGATVVGRADRSAIRAAAIPRRLVPHVTALDRRIDAITLADIDVLTGTGRTVGTSLTDGTVVATGSFSPDAIRRELRERGFESVDRTAERECFVDDGGRLAVGYVRSTGTASPRVAVGYGSGTARERVTAALEGRGPAVTRSGRRPTGRARALERVLDGNAVVTADLGAESRTRLSRVLADAASPFDRALGAADAVGVAATVGNGGDRTALRYGLVADPDRLSVDDVRAAIADADTGPDSVRVRSLERDGRAIVVDGDAATGQLVRAHETALNVDPAAGRRRVQSSAAENDGSDAVSLEDRD